MAESLQAQDSGWIFTFDDGTKIKRKQLADLILDKIDQNPNGINCGKVSEIIKMNYGSVMSIIRSLVTAELLVSEKRNRFTYYKTPAKCELTKFFGHDKITQNFTIKNKTSHKAEDFKNVSYGGTKGYEGWSSTMSNTIYEGGE